MVSRRAFLASAAVLGLGLAARAQEIGQFAAGDLRIGMLVPLSGPDAELGRQMLDSAIMAIDDAGEDRALLLPRDTKGAAGEGAIAAATQLLGENVQIVIGPLFAANATAAAPRLRAVGIDCLAFSNDTGIAGDGVWPLGFAPQTETQRVVAFARSRGATRFVAVASNTAYGRLVLEAFRGAVLIEGGTLVRSVTYDPNGDLAAAAREVGAFAQRRKQLQTQRDALEKQNDEAARRALARLSSLEATGELDFDALFIPEGGTVLLRLVALLAYYDIDPSQVRFLGTGRWDEPAIAAEPGLAGAWFAGADPARRGDFEKRFEAASGHRPARRASLAYDAASIAIAALKDSRGSRNALLRPQGWSGLDGPLRLSQGGMVQRSLGILEIAPHGPKLISPPPSFPGE